MSEPKARVSASVDPANMEAARRSVAAGRSLNVSAFINEGMARQREHEDRMAALDEFIGAYEREHGEITDEEMHALVRQDKAKATVVRGTPEKASTRRSKPPKTA